MRLKFFVFSVLMGLCMRSGAQQGGTLTLQQAIDIAVKNNTTVRQSEYNMQTQSVTLRQAKGNMLPDLIGNITHGINQGRSIDPFTNSYINQQINFASYNLSSGVTLFNGFQLLNTLRQQSLNYDAAKMDLQQNRDNITLNVIIAYLQVLNINEQIGQLEARADLSRSQVQRLEIMNKEGAVPPLQLYDLKGQLATDELSIVQRRADLESAKLELARLMNVPYDKNVNPVPLNADEMSLIYSNDVESIYNTATSQFAMVKAAELRRKAAVRGFQAAKGWYSPQIFLNANLNTNYSSAASTQTVVNVVDVPTSDYVVVNGNKFNVVTSQSTFNSQKISYGDQFKNNYSTQFALGVRIPFVNGLFARNQVAQARYNMRYNEFLTQTMYTQLKQSINEVYIAMSTAQERVRLLREQVAAYTESFRIAEVRFNAGLGTSIDYLTAKNNLDNARLALTSARYDYVFRTKILDYYQAKPLF
jgi:outer membrane protein